jgi:hypothetical protein
MTEQYFKERGQQNSQKSLRKVQDRGNQDHAGEARPQIRKEREEGRGKGWFYSEVRKLHHFLKNLVPWC